VSRYAPFNRKLSTTLALLAGLTAPIFSNAIAAELSALPTNPPNSRVVIVENPQATTSFKPQPEIVRVMVDHAVTKLTGKPSLDAAWLSLVSPKDVVGLKVFSAPGQNSGTRIAVVSAVIEGLLHAGIPPQNIVIWDRFTTDLRLAGFFELKERYGVRVQGSFEAGYDATNFYDTPFIGQLNWGDLEFGKKDEEVLGRKSFVSKLLTHDITKIINITPLLNHHRARVSGNLYGLATASVDNTVRFENSAERLVSAVPEIYALPSVGDKVVLNIVDALLCQYQGSQTSLLHYSAMLNQIRVSKDPVALDVLSIQDLNRELQAHKISNVSTNMDLYQNAALLELGACDLKRITVEKLP